MKLTTVQLQCDVCQTATRQGQLGESVTALRERLAPIGWRGQGNRDVCENCALRGHRP